MNEKKMVQWKRRSEQKEKKHEIIRVYLQGRFYYKEKKHLWGTWMCQTMYHEL